MVLTPSLFDERRIPPRSRWMQAASIDNGGGLTIKIILLETF